MNIIRKILERYNGLQFRQEYVCLSRDEFKQPIHAYIMENDRVLKEITTDHVFAGYSPLIFAVSSMATEQEPPGTLSIHFSNQPHQPNELLKAKDALATLAFEKFHSLNMGDFNTGLYTGINGKHHFLSPFHQKVIGLSNYWFNRKKGNVYLDNKLISQVQAAYSIPRTIALVSLGKNGLYNLFPTDLHGPVGSSHYIISLRHGGRAAAQVAECRNILLCEMDSQAYLKIYSLGKNHMKDLRPASCFPFSTTVFGSGSLPVPISTANCRELHLKGHIDKGIHRIFQFQVTGTRLINADTHILAHIHTAYATWRISKGLPGNYLLR